MIFKITILPGNAIGPEIINKAVNVLDAIKTKFGYQFEYEYASW